MVGTNFRPALGDRTAECAGPDDIETLVLYPGDRCDQLDHASGVTVAVSGVGAVGVGANIVAARLVSMPAGGRVLLLMVHSVTVGAG